MSGFGVERSADRAGVIDELAAAHGGRVGLDAVIDDVRREGRRGRRTWWVPGNAVQRAFSFDAADERDRRWWPQGVTGSAERGVVLVAWYAKERGGRHVGSRVSVFDLASRRYRHVRLGRPVVRGGKERLEPLRVHAGGLVWAGGWLHVAATAKGFWTAHTDDVIRVGEELVLPMRFGHAARTPVDVEPLRYSFLSLDGSRMLVGEYARRSATRRIASVELDAETWLPAPEVTLLGEGVPHMQGIALVDDRLVATVSRGTWKPGTVVTGRTDSLEPWAGYEWATPMGCEDLSWWPSTGELWSVSEHPHRRWIYSMDPTTFT